MRFTIITHVDHREKLGKQYAYGPYVREMNIWSKFADELEIVSPVAAGNPDPIDIAYEARSVVVTAIPSFNLIGIGNKIKALFRIPIIVFTLFSAMRRSDHIHLRCPGNIGLLGCLVQIFFPSKTKTAKYAGNWDPDSRQPWSYRVQKWVLSNTFLTRNIKVLVYGSWAGSTPNIVPFFTATYRRTDVSRFGPKPMDADIRFVFAGSLAPGKRPVYALELLKKLRENGHNAAIDFYGEGTEREKMQAYIAENNLGNFVSLKGNRNADEVREAFQQSHFVILPSKSEGWPKVVAEAMFWGCIPLATNVSCVPEMLGHGSRGILLQLDVDADAKAIAALSRDENRFMQMASEAMKWSRSYTLDDFEEAISGFVTSGQKAPQKP